MGAHKDSQQMTAMVRIIEMRRGLVRIFVRTENSDLASVFPFKPLPLSGNVTAAIIESWCVDNPSGYYWGYIYDTGLGWSLALVANKKASAAYISIWILGLDAIKLIASSNNGATWVENTVPHT